MQIEMTELTYWTHRRSGSHFLLKLIQTLLSILDNYHKPAKIRRIVDDDDDIGSKDKSAKLLVTVKILALEIARVMNFIEV